MEVVSDIVSQFIGLDKLHFESVNQWDSNSILEVLRDPL
jgi:hypothetical protein